MPNTIRLDKTPFKYGKKYCQHDEENILLTLFDRIGHKRTLCDIGARLQFSNSRRLIEDFGYKGEMIDANPDACADITNILGKYPIVILNEKITQAIERGQSLVLPRVSAQLEETERIRSALIATIIRSDGCYGVIYVDNAMIQEHYSLSDLDYLMFLAMHVAAILKNV